MELVSKKPGERQLARLFQARGGGGGGTTAASSSLLHASGSIDSSSSSLSRLEKREWDATLFMATFNTR